MRLLTMLFRQPSACHGLNSCTGRSLCSRCARLIRWIVDEHYCFSIDQLFSILVRDTGGESIAFLAEVLDDLAMCRQRCPDERRPFDTRGFRRDRSLARGAGLVRR